MNQTTPPAHVRIAAKAVIIRNDRLLTIRKRQGERVFHTLPGGGQKHGETLAQAVAREVEEEVGARAEALELLHVRDYIAAHHEFADQHGTLHKVELYFRCRLLEPVGSRPQSQPDKRQIGVDWIELARLPEADFWPRALVPILTLQQADAPTYLGDVN